MLSYSHATRYVVQKANETTDDGLAPADVYFEWLEEYLSLAGRAHYNDIVNTSLLSATSVTGTYIHHRLWTAMWVGVNIVFRLAPLATAMWVGVNNLFHLAPLANMS